MDKGLQTTQDRIKAYIYVGVEAEMEMIEAQWELDHLESHEDRQFWMKKIGQAQDKIAMCNQRIGQLEGNIYP